MVIGRIIPTMAHIFDIGFLVTLVICPGMFLKSSGLKSQFLALHPMIRSGDHRDFGSLAGFQE
jgi:uncharacterized membrane protein YciS (DUF1049 family)